MKTSAQIIIYGKFYNTKSSLCVVYNIKNAKKIKSIIDIILT